MSLEVKFENIDEFIAELRVVWPFFCSSAEEFAGFISGFCIARPLATGEFWDNFSSCIDSSDLPLPDAPWLNRVKEASPSKQCEIPLIYTLLDQHQKIEYSERWSSSLTDSWKEKFLANNVRLQDPYEPRIMPTPNKLMYVSGNHGYWHLFYVNDIGSRYYEVSFRTQADLINWAKSSIDIPVDSWGKEILGEFK